MKRAGWILAIAVVLVTSIIGLDNAMSDAAPLSGLQRSVQLAQLVSGLVGIVGGVGLWRRRPWCVTVNAAWAVVLVYLATVASFAFHDPTFVEPETLTGTIAAGVSTALIGALVVWVSRYSTRGPAAPSSTQAN